MNFQGALVQERGVTFGIVIVNPYIISNHNEANKLIASFQERIFVGHPVVLMAQDAKGTPTYYGRKDIVDFLARISVASIPWKEYTVN